MTPAGRTLLLLALSLMALVVGLGSGSSHTGLVELADVLAGKGSALDRAVLLDLRLPRVLSAYAVGGLLAVSGALLQALLRNPLADPYILGVSGGAAVGALLALLFGAGYVLTSSSAFAGALLSMLLVFGLGHWRGTSNSLTLLLTGVVIAAGWGAVTSLLLIISPDTRVQGMLFWLLGDLGQAVDYGPALAILVIGAVVSWALARPLNLLTRGELVLASLGTDPRRLRITVYFLASLLTAVAVSLAGSIAFVGLVTPHLLRLLGGSDHRVLIPQCVLLGGSFLLLADTLARTIAAPQQLPAGIITALIGIPVFLFLLLRGRRA